MNCGIAEVHNLAHKIAFVHRGIAEFGFFSTYTRERWRVAEIYSKQSLESGQEAFDLLHSLGGQDEDPIEARRQMNAILSHSGQRFLIEEKIKAQRKYFDNVRCINCFSLSCVCVCAFSHPHYQIHSLPYISDTSTIWIETPKPRYHPTTLHLNHHH